MDFPARSIRIFENRFTGDGEIVNLVGRCMIIKGITVYSVCVQRVCIEVSIQIRYVLFSHQWISTTSTKLKISPSPVNIFFQKSGCCVQENSCSLHFWSTNTMIYCLNAVSQLSQYLFPCLVQSGTQIREAAHVGNLETRSPHTLLCRKLSGASHNIPV